MSRVAEAVVKRLLLVPKSVFERHAVPELGDHGERRGPAVAVFAMEQRWLVALVLKQIDELPDLLVRRRLMVINGDTDCIDTMHGRPDLVVLRLGSERDDAAKAQHVDQPLILIPVLGLSRSVETRLAYPLIAEDSEVADRNQTKISSHFHVSLDVDENTIQ